jgi:energy-coupling factor transporter ATP-binding protein EcfA2
VAAAPVTALRFDGVTLRYGDAGTAPALADISLEILGGSISWLFGSLGAGCSSLLLVAAGLAPRHTGGILTGAVTSLGADPHDPAGRLALAGRIGYVTATPGVQLSGVAATVWEEVAFAPANLGWPIERIREAVAAALGRLGIGHLSGRDPAALSGGELQRVVIAAMLVLSPALWLLDEPASALDRAGRSALSSVLRAEADRGAAVVIASEDADGMAALADRLIVLDQGRIALDGAPRDLLAGDELWRHAAGSTPIASVARSAAARFDVVPASLAPPYPLTVEEGVARWS